MVGELTCKHMLPTRQTEPHLHFHIQNVEDINKATGVKCYFDKIFINGQVRSDYSPVKNEVISNVN